MNIDLHTSDLADTIVDLSSDATSAIASALDEITDRMPDVPDPRRARRTLAWGDPRTLDRPDRHDPGTRLVAVADRRTRCDRRRCRRRRPVASVLGRTRRDTSRRLVDAVEHDPLPRRPPTRAGGRQRLTTTSRATPVDATGWTLPVTRPGETEHVGPTSCISSGRWTRRPPGRPPSVCGSAWSHCSSCCSSWSPSACRR